MNNNNKALLSYNVVEGTEGKLLISDQKTAENISFLQDGNVTHVLSIGFRDQPFLAASNHGVSYTCVDIQDLPCENILIYLPRLVKIIHEQIVVLRKPQQKVLVHCVHGQSRSCAVVVAYLMSRSIDEYYKSQKQGDDDDDVIFLNKLLINAFSLVRKSRPCIAINPGFMEQLELYRRMLVANIQSNENERIREKATPPPPPPRQSRSCAHAAFRSSKIKAYYLRNGGSSLHRCQFHPNVDDDCMYRNHNDSAVLRCKNCKFQLFSLDNVVCRLSNIERSQLPSSKYWEESAGGKEATERSLYVKHCRSISLKVQELNCKNDNHYLVEPMMWMMEQCLEHVGDGNCTTTRAKKLQCSYCTSKIGSINFNDDYFFVSVLIQRSKVDKISRLVR